MKTKSGLFFILTVIIFTAVWGCSGSGTDRLTDIKRWSLDSLTGFIMPPANKNITLEFSAGGLFKGFGDCNNYSGNYKQSPGGKLQISNLVSTDAACEDSQRETLFFSSLQKSASFKTTGGKLFIFDGSKKLLLVMKAD